MRLNATKRKGRFTEPLRITHPAIAREWHYRMNNPELSEDTQIAIRAVQGNAALSDELAVAQIKELVRRDPNYARSGATP